MDTMRLTISTPGLWRHVTRQVQFSLVVDDFGVKYAGKENAQPIDWSGGKYCGITLQWDYNMQALTIDVGACAENVGKIQI